VVSFNFGGGVRLSPLGTSPVCQIMSVEQSVEWELAGEAEVLWENLPQCQFVHLKSHMTWPGSESGAAEVENRRLTAWAMARPREVVKKEDD
jgi:hypothetical protein